MLDATIMVRNDFRNGDFGCNSRDSQSGFPTDLDWLYRVTWKLRDRLHIPLGSGVVARVGLIDRSAQE